ncbi:hypothetical protein H4R35_001298 [Dimargaris xerosporica]|nr:hypothetical protein H4R35_001298 [Dimargaris xerosporica]
MHLADHQSDSDDNPAEWLNSSRILLAMITPDPAGLDPQAPRFHACFYDVTVKSLPVAFQLWGCDAVVDRAPELCTTNVTPMKPHISLPIWIRDKHCQVQALTDDAFTRACSWVLGPTQRLVSLDDGYLAAESQAIPSTGSTSSSIESLPDPARQRSDSTNECDGSYPCPSNDHSPSLSQQSSPPSPTSSPAQPTPHIAMDGTDVVQPRAELPVSLPAVAVTTTAVGADSSLPTSALNLGTAAAPAPLPPNASAEQVLIAQQRTIIHLLQQQLDVFSQQRQFAAPAPWRNQQMHRLEGADDFAAHDPELHEPYYTHEVNDREPGHHPPLPENAMLAAGTPARSITRKYVRVNQPGIQTAAAQAMTSCPEHGTGNVACYNHPQESQQEPGVITSHRTTALAPAMARAPHNSHAREPYQPETSGNGGMVMEAYEETEYITHYLPAHSSRAGPGQMHTRRYRAARMGHMPIHSSTHPTHYEDFTSQPPSHRLRAPSAKSLPPPTTDPMQALMSRVNDVLSVSTSVSTTNSPPVTSAVPHGTHSAGLAHPLLPPRPSIKPTGASAPVGITAPASSLLHDLTPMTKKYLQNLRQRN